VRKLPRYLCRDIRVILTCGCRILIHDQPRHRNSKFACKSNLGHGYTLGWVSWNDTADDIVIHNKEAVK
jgi:hypothetical protein